MGQVVVTIAGRTFRMNCEDGQESHLQKLAQDIDARTGDLRRSFGEIGPDRLVVMSALTIADDLEAARRRIEELEAQARSAQTDQDRTEAAARDREVALEAAIDAAASRVNRLLEALNAGKD